MMQSNRTIRWVCAAMVGVLPVVGVARRSKVPPVPEAWTYSIEGSLSVRTTATGAAATAMPPGLSEPTATAVSWRANAALTTTHPDGSVTELIRVDAPGTAMHGRAFGLRRFDDGEVLRVEHLPELAGTAFLQWDPILGAISPARPDVVTGKKPGNRALQWTARLGSAQFLRTNCPAKWTLVDDGGSGVEGWQGRPVEHLRYEGRCGLRGRVEQADRPAGVLRGTGSVVGEVWWDVDTHQILRHDLVVERTVRSSRLTPTGRLELTQEQTYRIRVDWSPAGERPEPIRALTTSEFTDALSPMLEGWTRCAENPGATELVVMAGPAGAIEVRTVREPSGPAPAAETFPTDPERLQEAAPAALLRGGRDTSCWQAVADGQKLPMHDDAGVEFTFVLPWRDGAFGWPALVERARPPLGPLFIVTDEAHRSDTEAWLGVR